MNQLMQAGQLSTLRRENQPSNMMEDSTKHHGPYGELGHDV
jgi:hypothetical protein